MEANQVNSEIREIYLAEYNNLCQEIIGRIDAQKQILNLEITIMAAIISVNTLFRNQPEFNLYGALLLSLLSVVMIEQSTRINNILTYVRTILSPKIDATLPNTKHPILGWPVWIVTFNSQNSISQLSGLIKFFIGPAFTIFLCISFSIQKNAFWSAWSGNEKLLSTIVGIILLLQAVTGIFSTRDTYLFIKNKAKKQK